ncbi:MAG: autoinducer binding domain-containing protein [SAR324 cluster bacterium]|nr:autoinducer binding domain-containing protein [SAR324 cluster bacterium]
MLEFSESTLQLKKLENSDQVKVSEIITGLITCKSSDSYQELIRELGRLISFQHWTGFICKMENEWEITAEYFFQTNYPESFISAYEELKLGFIDFVMINNFTPESFGHLQLWSETQKKVEGMKENLDPQVYKKHQDFLDFVKEWNILQEGYSIGCKTSNPEKNIHYGSIFSIADKIEPSERTETILEILSPYLHQALLKVWVTEAEG